MRDHCFTCRQAKTHCYCPYISRFDAKIKFVILIHPLEVRRRIATGRMSHLCLEDSDLIAGHVFTHNRRVNALIDDTANQPIVLYPGNRSVNLSLLGQKERCALINRRLKPVIFVIDGTWHTARKMVRKSPNLFELPQICFSPQSPSNFHVRKQPAPGCYSTIEAIHHTIELLGPSCGFDTDKREHDKLLYVFNKMVEQQMEFRGKVPRWENALRTSAG